MLRIATAALVSGLIALPAAAQTVPPFASITGPCSGTQLLSAPYLSVQGSTLSALSITNPSADTPANVQACAYDQQGNFLGGTSFAVSPNTWFIAANGGDASWTTLSLLFGGASLPSNASFSAVVASDIPVQIQGIVSDPALGARVIVQAGASPGTVVAANSVGLQTLDQGYVFLAAPGQAAATASIDLVYSDGTVVSGLGNLALAPFGSTGVSIGDLLAANGAVGGQGLITIRATDTVSGSKIAALAVLARISEAGGPYAVTLPLQIVQP